MEFSRLWMHCLAGFIGLDLCARDIVVMSQETRDGYCFEGKCGKHI
jgi:hypothetical protein